MAKIGCITTGLTGMLRASMALCKELEKAGHDVVYATPLDQKDVVRQHGLQYHDLPKLPLEHPTKATYPEIVESWSLEVLESMIKTHALDLLIVDMELHEYILHAWHLQHRVILMSQWFPVWQGQAPHMKSLAFPGRGLKGSAAGIRIQWQFLRAHRWIKNLIHRMKKSGRDRRSVLIHYARKVNFPMKWIDKNGWPPPFTYSGLPIMCLNNPALDLPGNQRKLDVFVGAQLDEDRHEEIEEKNEKRLERILAECTGDHKLICCTLSTMDRSNTRHLVKIVEAVASHANWRMIVTLGGKSEVDTTDWPENVHVFQWVPQVKILAKSDVSINHGGIHTINECVHFEVPMLIYPGGRHDQNGCAVRVAYHGIGVMGDAVSNTVDDVERYLYDLMQNDSYKKHLRALHELNMGLIKDNTANRYIEKTLNQTNPWASYQA